MLTFRARADAVANRAEQFRLASLQPREHSPRCARPAFTFSSDRLQRCDDKIESCLRHVRRSCKIRHTTANHFGKKHKRAAIPECLGRLSSNSPFKVRRYTAPRRIESRRTILKHAAVLPRGSLIQQFLFCFEGNHDVHLRTGFGACGKWLLHSCWPLMRVASGNSNRRLSIAGSA